MKTKRTSFLARTAMTLLFTVLTTVTTWADSWPEYITNVVLVGGTESEAQSAKSGYSGYTWCSKSLNDGTSGDVIYIGYKKSSSPAYINGGYITDFIIIDAGTGTEGHNPPYSLTFQGRTYYRCPAAGGDYFVNSNHGNLTSQASKGWNMYLYYTKANFSDKRAVDGISIYSVGDINEHKSGAIDCYYKNGTLHEAEISLNKGVSNTPYVYMHINTVTKTNRPSTDPVMASGLVYNGNEQLLVSSMGTTYDNTYKMWFREIGQNQYFYEGTYLFTKATNAGTYNVEYYAGSSTYGDKSETKIHQVTIAKSPNNGVTVSCSNYLEGTAPVPSLVGTNLSTGTVTYQYSTSQNGEYTPTVPSEPGTYWVKATIASDNNCDEYTTAAVSFKLKHDWGVHNTGNTADNAYVISTTEDLNLLSSRVSAGNTYQGKFFKLGGNITYNKNTTNNFTPIGNSTYSFKGTFDGNGKTISGINISLSSTSCVGLFGNAGAEATIKNLKIDNSTIGGQSYVGAILGEGEYQTHITNCLVTSSVSVSGQQYYVGGIVGNKGTITGCASAASVSGNNVVGGIMGSGYQSTITNCVYTGSSVTSSGTSVGAIVGLKDEYTTLNYNYYTANLASKGCKGSDINGARKAVEINTASGVTVTPTGTATTYNVSGITAYADNNVIGYGGHLFAGATESVSLDITYPIESFSVTGYNDGYGNALTHVSDNNYALTMTADAPTVTPVGSDLWGVVLSSRDGSAERPYLITEPAGLDLLAQKVNGGNGYQDTYFVLGNDIVYGADALTLDLDGDGNNDSNYMPVGNNNSSFYGNFDGQGHTISGIRVNANGIYYIGVFGINASTGTVKNLTVSDCLFTGDGYVGAIAGLNTGTVENCHVAADVSVTGNNGVGGIVGNNDGTTHRGFVLGCTSAATLSAKESAGFFGGIAGRNSGTLTDNLFTGTIDGMPDGSWSIGAITGYHDTDYSGTLTNNFHTCSGVGGVGNLDDATNTDQDGAQFAYEFPAANAAMGAAGSTYAEGETYEGITAYTEGLAYNGKFYSPLPWTGDGTAEHPFVISTTDGLDKLAIKVNGGTSYSGTYFELGADITYSYAGLGEGESNYTPIGDYSHYFSGTFDGKGHKVSGIRIGDYGTCKAIFGTVIGTVKNLVISDCRMEADYSIGGIVATFKSGTIENCHVLSDVTIIGNQNIGGIAARNEGGTVKGCTSAATITGTKSSFGNAYLLGGIVGYATKYGGVNPTLTDNLFTGTISGELYNYIGAIVGFNEGMLTNNYHTLSGMGGVGNRNDTTGSDEDGATFAYEVPAANAAMGTKGTTYAAGTDYTGITAYENGLAYNGKFYSPSPWGGSGTEADPYVIYNTAGMDKLANDGNGGNDYQDTYFVLGNDIVYAPDVLTLDLDGDGNNDSNYMPVGKNGSPFMGNFDGHGHTISGISVNEMYYIGVFGINDGTVKNLTVSDCLFAGSMDVGAVAGLNRGTVENCHLLDDVSVIGNSNVGGVVGNNEGSVLGCTSAAALSTKEYADYFGGIAGSNTGTLTDNLFTGTIDKMPDGSWGIGAITGYHNTDYDGTLTNNFHTCSGMGGVGNEGNATNTDQAGAQFAVSSNTKPDAATIGTAGTAYAAGETYEGITPYTHGLYYNGLYYYKDPNIAVWTGKGTETDPYVIRTTAELDLLATRVNSDNKYDGKYFELGADITYDGSENNFTPIGQDGYWFCGTFDGKGHTVSGIRISDTNGIFKAIFGYVYGTIKNLVVSDCSIEARQGIGGIVGYLFGGTIENCHVDSEVTLTGNRNIGGIAANLEGGTVIGCTSAATITGTTVGGGKAYFLGGISGYASGNGEDSPTLTDNLFTGTISGDLYDYIGAIVGKNNSTGTTLTNNYHTCSGLGGVGDDGIVIGSDEDGKAEFAVSSTTEPDEATIGTAGTPYAAGETYQGITPYTKGLFYNGLYYYKDPNTVAWTGKGTETDPYVIRTTAELDLLASRVNGGNKYSGKYFELGADITYDGSENNFTPIGENGYSFYGTFDGKGHTISGIRISDKDGTHKAIFGRIGGTVKNLVVSDCSIEGNIYVGGIVGSIINGTIENCHVLSNVTLTGYMLTGGIAGDLEGGTIIGCTSAARITGTKDGGNNARYLGGIAGLAFIYGEHSPTLTDNLFTGTISGDLDESIGAIVGGNDSDETTLTNNYHTCSGMGGVGDDGIVIGSDEDGKAEFAVSSTTEPDEATIGTAGTPYAAGETYQGITPYSKGLYYDGRYYWHEAFLRGDANGDGQVTITDAVAVVNYILGNPSENFNKAAANVNGDTDEHGEPIISITDAVGVVNIILNGGAASTPAFTAPALTAPEDDDASPVDPE